MTGEDWKFPISSDRLVAILKYRGMDAEALIVAQQRNIRSFVEAQESFAKGIEQLVDAQSGMLRGSVDRVSEVLPELAKQRSLQDMLPDGFRSDAFELTLLGQCAACAAGSGMVDARAGARRVESRD